MSDLDTIVQLIITAQTQFPTREGFGTPLIAGFHTVFPERTRSYANQAAMVADGFTINDPLVRAANKMFGQNPRPLLVKIGKRLLAPSQSIRFTPTDTAEDVVTSFSVVSPDGTVTAITRTNGPAETATTISTALTTLVSAIAGLTGVDNTGTFNANADVAGTLFDFRLVTGGLDILDMTADPGIATDLAAIRLADPDWYGLALDSNSKAEIAAGAAWAEAEKIFFIPNSADREVVDDTAGNIGETIDAANYARTALLWSESVLSYAGCAWLGKQLPTDAGSTTWAYKTLAGIVADFLTTTEKLALESNNVNYYSEIAGLDKTFFGTAGDGDFIDVQRTIDALGARIQVDVFTPIGTLGKLPYTNASVSSVTGIIRAAIRAFQDQGALDPETEPTVTAPLVKDVAEADRAARLLPDVDFSARLAGAIHKTQIAGVLTV